MKSRSWKARWILGAAFSMAATSTAAAEVYTPKVDRQSLLVATSPEGLKIISIYRRKDGKWAIDVPKEVELENAADQFIKMLPVKLEESEEQARKCPPCFTATCGNITTICSYAPRAGREGE